MPLSCREMAVQRESKRLRKRLVKLLLRVRPDIVITHDPWSEYFPYHPDNRAVGFAVLDAVIASALPLFLRKKSVAGIALEKRPEVWLMHPHEPSHVVDISGAYERKLDLIKTHASQFDDVLVWKKVQEELEATFSGFGKEIGVKYGEPYRIILH